MPCYVDALMKNGWLLYGQSIESCHLIADTMPELMAMARKIGMKDKWLQTPERRPHFDLTASRRAAAVQAGTIELSRREFVEKMQELGYIRRRV